MAETTLAQAVERFVDVTHGASDADLDRAWAWHAYDSEGVRFAFFRTYEELRELAAITAAARAARGGPTTAQRVLAQYHLAYRDLQAVLIGVGDDLFDRAPTEGEWPLRKVIEHIVEADWGFYVVVRYALDRHRAGDWRPERIPDDAWDPIIGETEADFRAVMSRPLARIREYYQALHERVLREFAGIGEAELALPSRYWEGYDLGLQFRLHRFESHLRQHTVQAEKTLDALGAGPSEAKRLARLLYAALAEAEGAMIGAEPIEAGRWRDAAAAIAARADEIAGILA